ncbi:MAG: (2Fe-2S)-binding protein [Chloroflexi bacterium]|nr:(2Fe-2S)-binding protein [Chloroflexota bacterium]
MTPQIEISFFLNGTRFKGLVSPTMTLLDFLRNEMELTGAKDSCGGEGECGACTVIMDGQAINSCLMLMGQLEGRAITTIEGLSLHGEIHPIQQAFISAGAVQCGFCTPGAVLATKALLDRDPNPSEDIIREALAGNLCRCTGYTKIVAAVRIAAREMNHAR